MDAWTGYRGSRLGAVLPGKGLDGIWGPDLLYSEVDDESLHAPEVWGFPGSSLGDVRGNFNW